MPGTTGLRHRLDATLPAGAPLPDDVYPRRHAAMRWYLGAHVAGLLLLAWRTGYGLDRAALACVPVLATLALSSALRTTRSRAVVCSLGVVWCSLAVMQIAEGSVEAHLHMYVSLAFVALYQDWAPFLTCVLGDGLIYVTSAAFAPSLAYGGSPTALRHPWTWAAIGCAGIAASAWTLLLVWAQAEERSRLARDLATEVNRAELARLTEADAERRTSADMLTQLARRNQGLLGRQVGQISQMPEQRARDLREVSTLADRMRRNAESLLVLSGEGSKRTWGAPEQLESVLTGAVASLGSDRARLAVSHPGLVSGSLARDLAHLVTELIDNALAWTPPELPVDVRAGAAADGRWLVLVDDRGPGLAPELLAVANARLRTAVDVRYADAEQLGLQVIARLAGRHGLDVSLVPRAEGGLTAVVWVPAEAIRAVAAQALVGAGA